MLAIFFAFDKGLAILRQVIIARQFGLSRELDVFNVANNVPDLLFALISGGALAVAFIPVLAEVLTRDGRPAAWLLFSRIANLAFLTTGVMAVVVAALAKPLVGWEVGIAPGFDNAQQSLVVELMRLNLIATLIFSISGLVMASLQANQHFLLPAIAPLLYNLGQIFGALVLSPEKGASLGPITLPAFGMGIHGLVYGVIIGSALHLTIQIPAMFKYQFRWAPSLNLKDAAVVRVLRLIGPRLLTMFFIQLIFLVRDNLASRLATGAVSALTYGWMIQQVPETLIGTAIGTALLPTLAEHFARGDDVAFQAAIQRALQVFIALTLPVAAILSFGLGPLVSFVFGFDAESTNLLMWVTRGYLVGLTGHALLELAARSFYARQNALIPLLGAGVNLALYITLGSLLFHWLGAPGVSLTDAIAFTTQSVLLLIILNRRIQLHLAFSSTLLRAVLAAMVSGGLVLLLSQFYDGGLSGIIFACVSMLAALGLAMPFIWKEMRVLFRL